MAGQSVQIEVVFNFEVVFVSMVAFSFEVIFIFEVVFSLFSVHEVSSKRNIMIFSCRELNTRPCLYVFCLSVFTPVLIFVRGQLAGSSGTARRKNF